MDQWWDGFGDVWRGGSSEDVGWIEGDEDAGERVWGVDGGRCGVVIACGCLGTGGRLKGSLSMLDEKFDSALLSELATVFLVADESSSYELRSWRRSSYT